MSGPLGHAWLRFLNGHKTSLKGQSLILYKVRLLVLSRVAHTHVRHGPINGDCNRGLIADCRPSLRSLQLWSHAYHGALRCADCAG